MTTALEGGEGSASRLGRFLPPGKTRCPLYRRLGGPQCRSGQVRKISPPTEIRSPDRAARSQSLYRLSYTGPRAYKYAVLKCNHKIFPVRKIAYLSYALRCIIIGFGNHQPATASATNPDSSAIFSRKQIIWTNRVIWQKLMTAISSRADLPCSGSRSPDETLVVNFFLRRIWSALFTCQSVIRVVY